MTGNILGILLGALITLGGLSSFGAWIASIINNTMKACYCLPWLAVSVFAILLGLWIVVDVKENR